MQPELPLFQPIATDPNVEYFVRLLRDANAWFTAREIAEKTNWTDRQIRAFAEASSPDIISGQKGYKHVTHATAEEVHHFCAWMDSQSAKMSRRSITTRNRYHQLVG